MEDLMLCIGKMLNYFVNHNEDAEPLTVEYAQAKEAANSLLNNGFATIETLPDGTKQVTLIPCKFVATCSHAEANPSLVKLKTGILKENTDFSLQDDAIKQIIGMFIAEQRASLSLLRSKFNIGIYQARKVMNFLIDQGILSEETIQRHDHGVLITLDEYKALCLNSSAPQTGFYIPLESNVASKPVAVEGDEAVECEFGRQIMNYQYSKPPIDLLIQYPHSDTMPDNYREMKAKIEAALDEYRARGEVIGAIRGPSFTRYEVQLAKGVDITKVKIQRDNIMMRLAVKHLGLEIPIACRNSIGLEIPNEKCDMVGLRDIVTSSEFQEQGDNITIGLGKDIYGKIICDNLVEMSHLLVAGATGSGKSVFIHDLIMSLVFKYSPEEVRFLMIDTKQVEFYQYNGMPHMLVPRVATSSDETFNMLNWVVEELQRRYDFLREQGVNNIGDYNEKKPASEPKMFRIIVIVDEIAELMLQSKGEVENAIQRIAKWGRACGVHMVLATQRPVASVISSAIKSNIACRVACKVSTGIESSIILDKVGAEQLLGHGDIIYRNKANDYNRLQSAFIDSKKEITPIVAYLIDNNKCIFDKSATNEIFNSSKKDEYRFPKREERTVAPVTESQFTMDDDLVKKVIKYFISKQKAAVSAVQSYFGLGYTKSKNIMNFLIDKGVVASTSTGNSTREVLMTAEEYEARYGEKIIKDTEQSE